MTMSLIAGVAAFVLTVLAMPHFITYYKNGRKAQNGVFGETGIRAIAWGDADACQVRIDSDAAA